MLLTTERTAGKVSNDVTSVGVTPTIKVTSFKFGRDANNKVVTTRWRHFFSTSAVALVLLLRWSPADAPSWSE